MAVHDTNAATAFEGLLQPVEEDETSSGVGLRNAGAVAEVSEGPLVDTVPFRPQQRPSFPLLLVVDDSQRTAESIRIRKSPFQIGRTEGDLTIPLDSQLSSLHAELFVKQSGGHSRWCLKDMGSTNGTFVRASTISLKANQILLIGSHRFRFEVANDQSSSAGQPQTERTRQWQARDFDATNANPAQLVALDSGPELSISLAQSDVWVGRDPNQVDVVLDDPLVSPRHVRLFLDRKGRWNAEGSNTLNGLWAQIEEATLDRSAWFQCGEQRFLFRPMKQN